MTSAAPPRAPAGPPPRTSPSVGSQALLILLGRILGAGSTAVLTILLARALGADGYGLYALAMSIGLTAAIVAELGVPFSTARYLATEYPDERRMAAVLRVGLRMKTLLAIGVALALGVAAFPLASAFGQPELGPILIATAVVLLFRDILGASNTVFHAFRLAGQTAVTAGTKGTVEIAAVVTLVVLGAGAAGAMWGSAIGFGVAALAAIVLMWRWLSGPVPAGVAPGRRELLGLGVHIWFAGLAWATFMTIDQILLGVMADPEAVAIYDAPWKLVFVLQYAGGALALAVGPRLADPHAAGTGEGFGAALRVALQAYVVAALLLLTVAATLMPALLGADFRESGAVLATLTPYLALLGVAPLVSIGLNYLGEVRFRKWIGLAAVLVNLGLDVLLIPPLGVIGPAIATNVAIVVYVGGHYVLCRRELDFRDSAVGVAAGKALLAGAAAAGIAAVLVTMTPGPGLVRVVVALVAGGTVGAGLLAGLGGFVRDLASILPAVERARERVRSSLSVRGTLGRAGALAVMVPAFAALAAGLGAVASQSPLLGIAAVLALGLAALLLADLTIGFIAFVVLQFIADVPQLDATDLSAVKLAGGIVFLAWLVYLVETPAGRRRNIITAQPLLPAAMGLFLAWGAVSLLWATNESAALTDLQRYALNFVLVLIAFSAIRERKHVLWLASAFVAGAVASSLSGISSSGTDLDAERLAGTAGDPNALAAIMVPGLIVGAAMAATLRSPIARLAFVVAMGICAVGLYQTLSRGGLVALAIAFVVWVLFGGRWRPRLAALGAVVAIATVGYFGFFAAPEERARVTNISVSETAGVAGGGSTGRTDIWTVGLRAWQENRVRGVGVGNFRDATPRFLLEPGLVRRSDLVILTPKTAHNSYLQVLVELGVVGLGLFLVIVMVPLIAMVKAAKAFQRLGDTTMEMLSRAIFAGTAGYLAAGFFISAQHLRPLWVLLAFGPPLLAIAVAVRRRRQRSEALALSA